MDLNPAKPNFLRQLRGACERLWQPRNLLKCQGLTGQAGNIKRAGAFGRADRWVCHGARMAKLYPQFCAVGRSLGSERCEIVQM